MKLADLRRLSIRSQARIHFKLRNGMECVVTEHGIAQVPSWKGIPDFNLEEELAGAGEFLLEPAAPEKKSAKMQPKPQSLTRAELAAKMAVLVSGRTVPEHDEE